LIVIYQPITINSNFIMITNLSYLESMSENNRDFIAEMVGIFREQIGQYKQQLPALLEESDFENLSKVAHKAKSSVAVMGMAKEAELLKELELNAKTGTNVDSFKNMIDTFINNSANALLELDEYLKQQQS
jgi:HPt (histidine-containing phosphotransfer) domain-containing protein